ARSRRLLAVSGCAEGSRDESYPVAQRHPQVRVASDAGSRCCHSSEPPEAAALFSGTLRRHARSGLRRRRQLRLPDGGAVALRRTFLCTTIAIVCGVSAVVLAAMEPRSEAAIVLDPGALFLRRLAPGDVHRFQLQLSEGEFARVVVEQKGIDVVIH